MRINFRAVIVLFPELFVLRQGRLPVVVEHSLTQTDRLYRLSTIAFPNSQSVTESAIESATENVTESAKRNGRKLGKNYKGETEPLTEMLTETKERLKEDYKNLQNQERELVQKLNEKYGPGTVDISNGEFIPAN